MGGHEAHRSAPQVAVSETGLQSRLAWVSEQFRELHRLSLAEHDSYAELYADYLTTGLRMLALDVGIVSRVEGSDYTVLAAQPPAAGFATGDVFPLDETYCSMVMQGGRTVAAADVPASETVTRHPAYRANPLQAYLAAPIRVGGTTFGTLNFTSVRPRGGPFTEEDVEFVELMARALGQVIERDQLDQERTRAAQLLRENMQLFESAFRYAAIGMALVSAGGRWLRVNHAVTEILGYSETQLLEIDFQSITHPEDLDADLVFVREMLEGSRQSYRMEKRYLHRDGQVVWVLLSVSLVRDDAGSPVHFISQLQDITERKRAEAEVGRQTRELQELNRKLEELAMVDPLTRVFNRRAFAQRLEAEISHSARTGMPLSLLLVDVDHFKRFNDEFGHPAGDKALKRVADGLVDAGRANDVVARYGGEEFAVILPNTDASGSRIVAERMRSAIMAIAGVPRPLRASLGGVSVHPARGGGTPVTAASLIRLADEALYAAKANGRNRCEHAETIG